MDKWAPSSMFMSEDANKFIGPDLLGIIGGIGFVVIAGIAFLRLREIKEYREQKIFSLYLDTREPVHTPDSEYAILKDIICKEQWGM